MMQVHVRILHSIVRNFLDRGFSGWRAQNWASIVPCPSDSTRNSTIYRLTSGLAGCLDQHCTSIVLCPPKNTRSSAIYKLPDELQGWRTQECDCLWMVIPINNITLSKNIIFNTRLLILNIDIVQFISTKNSVQYEIGKQSVDLVI
jgi:hypothetical protein